MLRLATSKPKPIKVVRKRKTKPRPKVSSRTSLERRADALVREIVLDRDGYCVCPAPRRGHTDVLQNGHLITRGRGSVKWDLYNCNVQCSGCNARHEHFAEIYTLWFIREFGQMEFERLVAESEEVKKLSEEELESMIENLVAIRRRQLDDPKWKPYYTQKQIISGAWRYETTPRTNLFGVQSPPNLRVEAGR